MPMRTPVAANEIDRRDASATRGMPEKEGESHYSTRLRLNVPSHSADQQFIVEGETRTSGWCSGVGLLTGLRQLRLSDILRAEPISLKQSEEEISLL